MRKRKATLARDLLAMGHDLATSQKVPNGRGFRLRLTIDRPGEDNLIDADNVAWVVARHVPKARLLHATPRRAVFVAYYDNASVPVALGTSRRKRKYDEERTKKES